MADRSTGTTNGIAYIVKYPAEEPAVALNPVIFLHAMLCSKEIWGDILQRVADATQRTVFAYDAVNHGETLSVEPVDEFKFERNVPDLLLFMKGLNIKEAILVGHDMGGITAIHAALENKERFEKVFIIDMHATKLGEQLISRSENFMKEWSKALGGINKNIAAHDVTKTVVPVVFANLPGVKTAERDLEEQAYLKAQIRYKRNSDGGYENYFNQENLEKALADFKTNQKEYKGTYDRQAYFFHGESHYNVETEKDTIKKHFQLSAMVKFDKASHFLFLDSPDEFVTKLVKYIKQ